MEIDMGETHIRLTSDLESHDLKSYIRVMRRDLKSYISRNRDFLLSMEPVKSDEENLPLIVRRMYESSFLADVGPMACVAGAVSELSLDHLIEMGSKHSIVENGGDIAMVNDRKVLCGIYSGNEVLGNEIAFEITPRKSRLGICTSSGKIGHSISFGEADSVTVMSKSPSIADGLATRIANEATGIDAESMISNALECSENYRDLFSSAMIVCGGSVGTVGKLPRIVETSKFDFKKV